MCVKMDKIIIVGQRGVGKTSLILHLKRQPIHEPPSPTEERELHEVVISGKRYTIIDGGPTPEDIKEAKYIVVVGEELIFDTDCRIIRLDPYPTSLIL